LPAARTVIVVYKLLTHRPASVVHLAACGRQQMPRCNTGDGE